jgi:putative oxidoreductase
MSAIVSGGSWRAAWNRGADALGRWLGLDLVLLASRLGIAAVFFQSGRTKLDGWLGVSDGAVVLFRDDTDCRCSIPLSPPTPPPTPSTSFRSCSSSACSPAAPPWPCSA